VSAAFAGATFDSVARPDVMRWKYRKLEVNLGNAADAVAGAAARSSPVVDRAVAEAEAVFDAAGIDRASEEEDMARRGDLLRMHAIDGDRWQGGSSWQSLARGAGSIETDYLNGEIVLLGRLHGVPTPVNELLQRLAREAAAAGRPPGTMSADDVLALLPA
jgi:2-dehydropantoate 2-reductase